MTGVRSTAEIGSGVTLRSRAGRAIIAAAVLGSALAYMSDDMLNVALPTIARDLDVGVTEMQWVVNGYFVAMLSLMLVAGSIGDIRGHRRMFLVGLVVFAAGAVVTAVAPVVPLLVAGRAVQGTGAAFLLASGLALVNGSFAEEESGRAVGLYMGFTAVATAAGPVLGGLIVDVLSWRAIFVVPLIFPVAAAIVTSVGVAESQLLVNRRPDTRGASLAFVTILAASFVLIRGPANWLAPEVMAAIAIAVAGGVSFLRSQKRSSDPILPLWLFRVRRFVGGNAVTLLAYLVSAGAFFFVVVQLQTTLGYEPALAGAAMVPLYIIMLVGSPLSGKLADAVGPRLPIVAGLGILAAGTWWLSFVAAGTTFLTGILPGLVTLSVGLAMVGAPLTSATLGAVGESDQGVASGVNNTVGQLAGLLMIAVLPVAAGLSGQSFDGPEFAAGYEAALRICAVLSLVAAAIAAATMGAKPPQTLAKGG